MTAYTLNDDKTINVLGGAPTEEILHKILPGKEFLVTPNEPFQFDGKFYLSEADVTATQKQEKELRDNLQKLEGEYIQAKNTLRNYYTDAMLSGDTETADEIKAELQELNDTYDAEVSRLTSGN